MELIENYKKGLAAIYEHVGFTEDWVTAPLDDKTDSYWNEDGEKVMFAGTVEEFETETGDYYEESIYKSRFYNKWVYAGEDLTMIFCDSQVDGMKWLRLFDNRKRRS